MAEVRLEPRYAVDTEFHRERTYFPQVALLQIAWSSGLVLIDPLAVDLALFAEVLTGPGVAVMHAAAQDIEVLQRACGAAPTHLVDTQLAGAFVGHGIAALGALVEREVGVRLPKGDRLADWLRRPLDDAQREYAASDVVHLLAVWDRLHRKLEAAGRLAWVEDECADLLARATTPRDPAESWWRIKEARQLRWPASGVAQAVAAWREHRAAEIDQPVRFELPDLALVGIAQRPPRTLDELRRVRGLDDRHVRKPAGSELLAAVTEGTAMPRTDLRTPPSNEVEREMRAAITLVSAWISQLARDLGIDPSVLATRSDLEALLRGDPDARLATGWRGDAVGDAVRRVVDGKAALAFDGAGGLVLEERSNRPLA